MYFGSRVISSGKHSAIKPGMSPAVGRALYNEPELYTAAWVLCLTGQMFLKSARVFLKNTRVFLKMFHFSKRVQATKKRANTKVKARMQKKMKSSQKYHSFSPNVPFFSKCFISQYVPLFSKGPKKKISNILKPGKSSKKNQTSSKNPGPAQEKP